MGLGHDKPRYMQATVRPNPTTSSQAVNPDEQRTLRMLIDRYLENTLPGSAQDKRQLRKYMEEVRLCVSLPFGRSSVSHIRLPV